MVFIIFAVIVHTHHLLYMPDLLYPHAFDPDLTFLMLPEGSPCEAWVWLRLSLSPASLPGHLCPQGEDQNPPRKPHTDRLWALSLTTHFSFLSVSSNLLSLPLPALAGQTTLLLLHHLTLTTSPNGPTPCSQKPSLATPSGEVPVVYSCGPALLGPPCL